MPLALVVSEPDPASLNIRDALLRLARWEETGTAFGKPTRAHGPYTMVEIPDLHIHAEGLDARLAEAGLRDLDGIVVASKHQAASGSPSLTVHPVGNYRAAEHGGAPATLAPAMPAYMARILRLLHRDSRKLSHQATYEATHHGPRVDAPLCFVEIGSREDHWRDPALGELVARVILEAGADEALVAPDEPVLVAVGGSHYAPRATDLARKHKVAIGHLVPNYHLHETLPTEVILQIIEKTPGVAGYFIDPRTPVDEPLDELLQAFASLDLGRYTEADLTPL